MKYTTIIISMLMIFFSCKKENNSKFIYINSDKQTKFNIVYNGTNIVEYSKFINNKLVETTTFNYYDTIVEKLTLDSLNNLSNKILYLLDENGFAIMSFDSSFSSYGNFYAKSKYTYQNNYLIEHYYNYQSSGNYPDTGSVKIVYEIQDGNYISKKVMPNGWSSGCTDYFDFNNRENKIDIVNFSNGITGKINNNLSSHIIHNYGCPCGPSSSIATSDFSYEVNSEGYVTKSIEKFIPCYHITTAETVYCSINTIEYEYSFIYRK